MFKRRNTKNIFLGNIGIGSSYPVSIQSMTNTDTRNSLETIRQIKNLAEAGCEIIRVAVPDEEAVNSLPQIIKQSPIPVIADIHFDYRLAIKACENGVAGLRINPGNIGSELKIKEIINSAQFYNVPIRIGVNAGSLEKDLIAKYNDLSSDALVESALRHINIFEKAKFSKIKLSLKSSNVSLMIDAYRKIATKVDYPLHIGVTEAGTVKNGTIKSAIGIGTLLAEGIGDTIRVSLTGDPINEITVAIQILKALDLRKQGVELISCPTCGRCQIDLDYLAEEVDKLTANIKKPLKIAIMGCVVNGPGEAREADLGIAGGRNEGLLFKKGKIIAKVPEKELLKEFKKELENMGRSDNYENN